MVEGISSGRLNSERAALHDSTPMSPMCSKNRLVRPNQSSMKPTWTGGGGTREGGGAAGGPGGGGAGKSRPAGPAPPGGEALEGGRAGGEAIGRRHVNHVVDAAVLLHHVEVV